MTLAVEAIRPVKVSFHYCHTRASYLTKSELLHVTCNYFSLPKYSLSLLP
jgi:hypothetical protein